ncbi:glycosyltransferase family 61 protein [Pelagibacteraceae bacterium]|nr:glycosyltransferase family 61 protein [Pelagibacteraceae bacterium]
MFIKLSKKGIKLIKYSLFKIMYGEIKKIIRPQSDKNIILNKAILENSKSYNCYNISNGRIFSDTVNNTAYILKDCLIKDVSYQFKLKKNLQIINGNTSDNFVIKNGTPKILKKINGTVFSLLSGGAAKNNYWHWIFDVLPKLAILEKSKFKNKPDYYLLPSLYKKYQIETLSMLKIPLNKLLNGEIYKHIICDNLLAVDHPNVFNNNPSKSIINIPHWIIKWLRKKYIKKNNSSSKKYERIYINREKDSILDNRKIINNQDVKEILNKFGFKIITVSDYSFNDQVKIFSNAKFIVGLHGAAFANLVFSKQKTKIIELASKHSGNIFANLAKNCKLDYRKIVDNKSQSKHQNNPIMVDLKKLKKLIYPSIK